MSLILNIDTSTEVASVCLAIDGKLVAANSNHSQKDHAAFLQPAIQRLLKENNYLIQQLDAIAVAKGPGSYTGLRVGMASAKGLCYGLSIPLVTISTLELMAASGQAAMLKLTVHNGPVLLCPMIDARRMEVFTALYDAALLQVIDPMAMILDEHSFNGELNQQSVLFFGNGAAKWKTICHHPNAFFDTIEISPDIFSLLSYKLNELQSYTSLAYSEPFYLKAFHSTQKRQHN